MTVRLALEGIGLLGITMALSNFLSPWTGLLMMGPFCIVWLWKRTLTPSWQREISDRMRRTFG